MPSFASPLALRRLSGPDSGPASRPTTAATAATAAPPPSTPSAAAGPDAAPPSRAADFTAQERREITAVYHQAAASLDSIWRIQALLEAVGVRAAPALVVRSLEALGVVMHDSEPMRLRGLLTEEEFTALIAELALSRSALATDNARAEAEREELCAALAHIDTSDVAAVVISTPDPPSDMDDVRSRSSVRLSVTHEVLPTLPPPFDAYSPFRSDFPSTDRGVPAQAAETLMEELDGATTPAPDPDLEVKVPTVLALLRRFDLEGAGVGIVEPPPEPRLRLRSLSTTSLTRAVEPRRKIPTMKARALLDTLCPSTVRPASAKGDAAPAVNWDAGTKPPRRRQSFARGERKQSRRRLTTDPKLLGEDGRMDGALRPPGLMMSLDGFSGEWGTELATSMDYADDAPTHIPGLRPVTAFAARPEPKRSPRPWQSRPATVGSVPRRRRRFGLDTPPDRAELLAAAKDLNIAVRSRSPAPPRIAPPVEPDTKLEHLRASGWLPPVQGTVPAVPPERKAQLKRWLSTDLKRNAL